MGRVCMGRVCYGPSLSWAEFVMGRVVQLPKRSNKYRIRFDYRKSLGMRLCLSIYLCILPYALADILGRVAQRLLVSDRKKKSYSTEV